MHRPDGFCFHRANPSRPNPSGLSDDSPMTLQCTDLTGFAFTGLIGPAQTRQVFPMTLQCFFKAPPFWVFSRKKHALLERGRTYDPHLLPLFVVTYAPSTAHCRHVRTFYRSLSSRTHLRPLFVVTYAPSTALCRHVRTSYRSLSSRTHLLPLIVVTTG